MKTKQSKPIGRPRKRRKTLTSKDDDGSFGYGTEIAVTSTSKGN